MSFWQELRKDLHPFEDQTRVEVYASTAWSGPAPARSLPGATTPRPAVSLIATVKNESAHLDAWLATLLAQTRLPDEIVIVDGGSTDDTLVKLQAFAAHSPVPALVSQATGANIARGRNLAIDRAAGPIIACTDAGCELAADWLAAITGPFAADREMEVVAGYYAAIQQTDLERVTAAYLIQPAADVEPQKFLPSMRSAAFRKEAWQAVGGFPEWLTLTAEDTVFGVALKRATRRWAFVPEAVVRWRLKPTLVQLFRQVHVYGRGDGEAGLWPEKYRGHIDLSVALGLAVVCVSVSALVAALAGPPWLLVAAWPALWLAQRLWRMTLRPKLRLAGGEAWPNGPLQSARVWALSAIVAVGIQVALALGYVEGVRLRLFKAQSVTGPRPPIQQNAPLQR